MKATAFAESYGARTTGPIDQQEVGQWNQRCIEVGQRAGSRYRGGSTLAIEEWAGSAPGELHVHHTRDIAWHVMSGSLSFRVETRRITVTEGGTLFIPAGVAHTYGEGDARYLVIASPELFALFRELRQARIGRPHTEWGLGPDGEIYRRHESELLDMGEGRPLP